MQEFEVKSVLSRLGLAPSKLRGQNFLCDGAALHQIIEFANLPTESFVLEIGPGLGAMTAVLRQKKHPVLAVELDRGFAAYLEKEFIDDSEFSLRCQDARLLALDEVTKSVGLEKVTVVSNVPYSISTDLLLWAVAQRSWLHGGCYLLQKEFAERVAASPGSKAYGSLSVFVQQYFDFELGPTISGDCFYPKAGVESRLLRFTPLAEPREQIDDPEAFESMVRALFKQRRKTLRNNFCAFCIDLDRESIESIFADSGIEYTRRAESLSLAEFAHLFRSWQARAGN